MDAFHVKKTRGAAKRCWHRTLTLVVLGGPLAPPARAQAPAAAPVPLADPKAPYLDPDRTPDERAADLVSRMTLEEKVTQLTNDAGAIPRRRW